jgi:deoxyribodipyrimidine photo-lyase
MRWRARSARLIVRDRIHSNVDIASNPGNAQWVAGSGADAAPCFRIFNPMLQGEKFDPAGDYVHRFVAGSAHSTPGTIRAPLRALPFALAEPGAVLVKPIPSPSSPTTPRACGH